MNGSNDTGQVTAGEKKGLRRFLYENGLYTRNQHGNGYGLLLHGYPSRQAGRQLCCSALSGEIDRPEGILRAPMIRQQHGGAFAVQAHQSHTHKSRSRQLPPQEQAESPRRPQPSKSRFFHGRISHFTGALQTSTQLRLRERSRFTKGQKKCPHVEGPNRVCDLRRRAFRKGAHSVQNFCSRMWV